MAKSKEEIILIQDGNTVIELIGAEKEAFLADREAREQERLLLESEYKAKQLVRESAIAKLTALGLTEEEIEGLIK
jgi:hypothetical protein